MTTVKKLEVMENLTWVESVLTRILTKNILSYRNINL
jgi:hypothetical protein